MTVFEMAKKYYPALWDKARLDQLLKAKKLTQAEYDSLVERKEEKA
ncbi:MAG: XkdX family protein [Clostridiaceae bacterium]|nr:XkdX family protein [Clostridiaceae bacterium]